MVIFNSYVSHYQRVQFWSILSDRHYRSKQLIKAIRREPRWLLSAVIIPICTFQRPKLRSYGQLWSLLPQEDISDSLIPLGSTEVPKDRPVPNSRSASVGSRAAAARQVVDGGSASMASIRESIAAPGHESSIPHRIGLWEHLQESPIYLMVKTMVSCNFSLKPIQ